MTASAAHPRAFAAALGVSISDLPALGDAFAGAMEKIGVDGKAIFQKLSEGKSLAAALQVPAGAIPVLYARAHNYFSIGRPDKAAVLFRALCALAGEKADHWAGLGICHKILGRLDEAEAALAAAAARRPGWPLPYFHMTDVALRRKDWKKAETALEEFDKWVSPTTESEFVEEAQRFRTAITLHFGGKDSSNDSA